MTMPGTDADSLAEYNAVKDIWFSLDAELRFKFIEENVTIQTTRGVLIPLMLTEFQKKWFLDGPLFNDFTKVTKFSNRICLKCRNAGASYVMIAVEATLAAWVYPNIFIPFVSATEQQAIDLVKYCKRVLRNVSFSIPLEIPLENQPQTQITFANGSSIRSFAGGNPDGIRGPRALLSYLDEFAFVPKQQEVLSAVEYFHTEGGQLNILSTPYGKQNRYWQIWADRDNYKGWKRHPISLFTDMTHFDVGLPLPGQVTKRNLKLSCPWLNLSFLEDKRQQDAPFNYANFLQETCGVPLDEVTAAISEAVLDTNSMDYYLVEARPLLEDGSLDMNPIYIMSLDFGAEKNMTAVTIWEAKDGRLICAYTEQFRGPFPEQLGKVQHIAKRFLPQFVIGDETGMGGQNWMSMLQESLPGTAVKGINYSKHDFALQAGVDMNNKNWMVVTAIRYMSQGFIIIPKNHRQLREELLGLEKLVYERVTKYSGKNGPVGSDDLAFSGLQGMILYDHIYTLDAGDTMALADRDLNSAGSARSNMTRPRPMKVESFEAAQANSNESLRTPDILGFHKLI